MAFQLRADIAQRQQQRAFALSARHDAQIQSQTLADQFQTTHTKLY